jgi:ATP synthase protein I
MTSSPAEVAMAESIPPTGARSEIDDDMADYARLKRRLIQATLIASAAAVPIAALAFGLPTAGSLLVGALAGLLYLWLLSRSVDKLGNGARSVGKVQLLVPVVLVIASTKIPQLDLLPALIGFLLYKPALLIQGLLDVRVGSPQR